MITTEVYGFEGTGKTLKEARENAQEAARKGMTGSYTPSMLVLGDQIAIIWREPTGWQYRNLDTNALKSSNLYGNGGYQTEQDCSAAARRHLAQNAWTPGCNTDELIAFVNKSDRLELATWINWQQTYADAKAHGYDADECRRFADQGTSFAA